MAITKEQVDQLLSPIVARVFDDGRAGMADRAQRSKFTGVENTMEALYDRTGSTDGFNTEAFNLDASGRVQQSSPEKVLERDWEQKEKYAEIRVSKLVLENILNNDNPIVSREITQRPRVLGRAYEIYLEKVAADALNYGFVSSGKTANGFDSVGLFKANHAIGQNTIDNTAALPISRANVETVIDQLDALQDAKGNVAGFVADALIVPPALQNVAWTIANELNAGGNPTYANHRINEVIVNPYLTDTNAWYVIDSARAKEHLLFRFRGEATLAAEVEFYIDHSVRAGVWQLGRSFDFNWDDPRFIVGSNPS